MILHVDEVFIDWLYVCLLKEFLKLTLQGAELIQGAFVLCQLLLSWNFLTNQIDFVSYDLVVNICCFFTFLLHLIGPHLLISDSLLFYLSKLINKPVVVCLQPFTDEE